MLRTAKLIKSKHHSKLTFFKRHKHPYCTSAKNLIQLFRGQKLATSIGFITIGLFGRMQNITENDLIEHKRYPVLVSMTKNKIIAEKFSWLTLETWTPSSAPHSVLEILIPEKFCYNIEAHLEKKGIAYIKEDETATPIVPYCSIKNFSYGNNTVIENPFFINLDLYPHLLEDFYSVYKQHLQFLFVLQNENLSREEESKKLAELNKAYSQLFEKIPNQINPYQLTLEQFMSAYQQFSRSMIRYTDPQLLGNMGHQKMEKILNNGAALNSHPHIKKLKKFKEVLRLIAEKQGPQPESNPVRLKF